MPESVREKVERIRAERLAREAAARANGHAESESGPESVMSVAATGNTHDEDLIPEVETTTYQPSEEDLEIDRLISGLDILTAYRRWCGKMEPKVGNKSESIMISCPKPDHRDSNPSAWVNTDNNTWFCGGCQEGGDVIDLIARTKGWDANSYKQGKNYPELRREIAADMGVIFRTTPGGTTYAVEVEPDESPEPPASNIASKPGLTSSIPDHTESSKSDNALTSSFTAPEPKPVSPGIEGVRSEDYAGGEPASAPDDSGATTLAPIVYLRGEDEPERVIIPRIEWMSIVQPDTFLYDWMNVMRHDDLPDEFYFWHGLVALGLAAGRDAVLADRTPVTGNLFICLYGPSGQGKTRSTAQLSKLLRQALPHDKSDPNDTGCYIVPPPGSPEVLIDSFSRPIPDPADPKVISGYGKVRGLVRFDELSTLIGRAGRTGNPLKPALQQFYDADPFIATASRGHGDVQAHDAFCSAVTTTQPRAIRQVLVASDVDSGFANRWVYVMGHSKPPVPFGGATLDISGPVDQLKKVRAWCAFGRNIDMTIGSLERWNQFYRDELAQYHSSEDAMTSRIPLLMKKLVLLLAINAEELQVSLDTVESAILLYPYIQRTYGYLSGDLGTGERQELDNAIIKAVKDYTEEAGKPPAARDILRRMNKMTKSDSGMVRRALDDLCALGVLDERITKPKTGRPTTRYVVKED